MRAWSLLSVFLALSGGAIFAETSPTPSMITGIEGVMTISPIHGGPIRQGVPSSGPLARTEFVVQQDERTVAEFVTDDAGRFQIALAPGTYTIVGKGPKRRIGSYGPKTVEVVAGRMMRVEWDFDTGMR